MIELLVTLIAVPVISLFCLYLEIADKLISDKTINQRAKAEAVPINDKPCTKRSRVYRELHKKDDKNESSPKPSPENEAATERLAAMQIDFLTNNGISPELAREVIEYTKSTEFNRSNNDSIKLNKIMNELLSLSIEKSKKPLS